ncbi:hypothetical protein [Archangium sp.]|uniref:hypothetical protein n=1 Tax=Archangium sp. TaxID=1872627 RepID=UPI002D5B4C24|nr:hypothetical protein [Archangium sp.]HYO53816.1 hypothetical protein [Archangium sp.]
MVRIGGTSFQVGIGDMLACAPGLASALIAKRLIAKSQGFLADFGWTPRPRAPGLSGVG